MKALRFLLFNIVAWITVITYAPLVIVGRFFGRKTAFAIAKHWANLALWLVEKICGLSYRITGFDNLPDDACIVFLKHSSAYETVVQLARFPMQSWVLKRELVWVPFFGWALATLNPIAIDRSKGGVAVKQVLDQGRERLQDGINIMIFPEGTRMPAGQTRRYGLSGTLLAQENDKLIVPVAHNAGYFWPRRGFGIEPGEVNFVIGKPIDPSGREPRDVNADIQKWIEAEVAKLVNNNAKHSIS